MGSVGSGVKRAQRVEVVVVSVLAVSLAKVENWLRRVRC